MKLIRELYKPRPVKIFASLIVALFLTMFIFENINGRFWLSDFKVMYSAAEALVSGDQVYGTPFGLPTGFYKYSPVTAFFFVPYTWLPYLVASGIQFWLIVFCAITAVVYLQKMVRTYFFSLEPRFYLTLYAAFLPILIHLVREIHLGNINMILLLLIVFAIQSLLKSQWWKFGLLAALIVLTKPYFAVLILPLIVHKKYKAIEYTSLFLLGFLLVSVLLLGGTNAVFLYGDWSNAMLRHSVYLDSYNTIFSLINYYAGTSIPVDKGLIILGVFGLLLSAVFWWIARRKKEINEGQDNVALIFECFLLVAIIPNLLITDTEHFLLSLPLITLVVMYLAKKRNFFGMFLFLLLMMGYGAYSPDVLGDELSESYKQSGILGLSNLILWITAFIIYWKNRNNWGISTDT